MQPSTEMGASTCIERLGIQMKSTFFTMALAAFTFALAGCSQDIRDIKTSQLTQAQTKQIRENLKPAELALIQRYALTKSMNNYADLSVNEILKVKDGKFPLDESKITN